MISEYRHRNLLWLDISSPTREDAIALMDRFGIASSVAEEFLTPSLKPKVEIYHEYLYLILHFPAIKHSHSGPRPDQEVDFIIGKDFIITGRYDTIDPLHKFSKVFEVNSVLDKSALGDHAGYVFFFMIRKLYKSLMHELDSMSDELFHIEERIFHGKERAMVAELSKVSRSLLAFKQAVRLHKEVLESFEVASLRFFGEEYRFALRSILGSYWRVWGAIESRTDTLQELRATNDSLLSSKQNEIMKTIAIISFVTFPLTLIAAIFGMNTKYLPIVGTSGDFWIVMGMMLVFTSLTFSFFRYKNWL